MEKSLIVDIKNKFKFLSDRYNNIKDSVQTEEATKNAFIMPFIQILGYDVFNPTEVVPEFIADIGIKKGEKVDYAIIKNNNPIIIIECKKLNENLSVHNSQLLRYFNVTKTRFGILTNGLTYRFYTDLTEKNIMDTVPFLEFDINDIKDFTIEELWKFHKTLFNCDDIVNRANYLKYYTLINNVLNEEFTEPSEDFMRFILKRVDYNRPITKKVIDEFVPIIKKTIFNYFDNVLSDKLQSVINKKTEELPIEEVVENKIITTEEEIEAYHIVKSILRTKVDVGRISSRDTQSYYGVLLDDNNRKPICRLYFNSKNKYISFVDEDRHEEKILLNNLDEIYLYTDKLIQIVENLNK